MFIVNLLLGFCHMHRRFSFLVQLPCLPLGIRDARQGAGGIDGGGDLLPLGRDARAAAGPKHGEQSHGQLLSGLVVSRCVALCTQKVRLWFGGPQTTTNVLACSLLEVLLRRTAARCTLPDERPRQRSGVS